MHALAQRLPEDHVLEVHAAAPIKSVVATAPEFPGSVRLVRHETGYRPGAGRAALVRAWLCYARQVRRSIGNDVCGVVASSSRMANAVLGARISARAGCDFYLDLRDIFSEAFADVYRGRAMAALSPLFAWLEKRAVRSVRGVNVVSPGFAGFVQASGSKLKPSMVPNGIDAVFSAARWQGLPAEPRRRLLYAGNIGDGQALDQVLPALARHLPDWQIDVIGDGGREALLRQALARASVSNVVVLPPVSRDALIAHYNRADALFLHLADLPAFERVLPSKLFEYAASQRPILAGVNGVAKAFIDEHLEGVCCFSPGNAFEAAEGLRSLNLQLYPRSEFVARFNREALMDELSCQILADLGLARLPTTAGQASG